MQPGPDCYRLSLVALGLLAALAPATGSAQARAPMQEVVITATRSERSALDSPFMLHVLDADTLSRELQARSVPEALREIPGVMVQKTAHGQGSPFIRGFTGFRTLFLIDGIRLNNSTFRDGPNQYWNTVDPLMIQRLEVVKGPSSVLYGSDAVGGTVNALLMRPQSTPQGDGVTAHLSYRTADAEDSGIARAQVGFRSGDVSFLAGYSLKDFGDLTSGAGLLPRTGYDEDDADLRLEYELSDSQRFVVAHQRLTQDDAWRTHATVFAVPFRGSAVGTDLSRILEQGRDLTYVQYYSDDRDGVVDAWNVSVSAHDQEEFQHRHRGDNLRVERQGYTVDTTAVSLQAETEAKAGRWVYGIEQYHDSVDSFREDFNANGTPRAPFIQGPVADDATYDLAGIYAERQIPIGANWEVISGLRYTYAAVDAERVLNTRTNTQMSIVEDWDDSVASVRFRYGSSETWNLFGGVSQGFRAPNLSDLTRLDTARSGEIETPVAILDPEQYVSYEFGFKASAARSSLQMAVYYTDVEDMILRTPTGTTIGTTFEVTKRNSGHGFTRGFELEGGYDLTERLSLWGAFTWSDGELESFPTSSPTLVREPMSRIMPPTTLVALRWSPNERYWFEASALHAEEQTKLAASDRLDTQRIPPDGTPGYSTLNLRSTMTFGNNVHLSAALENITDQNYRVHGSGINEAGRNVVLTMEWQTR